MSASQCPPEPRHPRPSLGVGYALNRSEASRPITANNDAAAKSVAGKIPDVVEPHGPTVCASNTTTAQPPATVRRASRPPARA